MTEYQVEEAHEAGMLFSTFRPFVHEGTKRTFAQHTINRKEIVAYDVKTFGECTARHSSLRLTLTSLAHVAQLLPEFAIPDPIPATHDVEEEPGRTTGSAAGQIYLH